MSSPLPDIAGTARQAAKEPEIITAIIRPEYRCEGGGKINGSRNYKNSYVDYRDR